LLGSIVEGSRKLQSLVQSLLQFATAESASEEIESFSVADVLQEVRTNLAPTIASASADLSWGPMPVIRAHRVRVLRLLQNLVSNAIKYARPGVPPVIRISAIKTGNEWRIDVEDNGAGIPPHEVERIFMPLTRLHGADIRSQRNVQDIDVRQLVSRLKDQGVIMKYNPASAPPPSI
jgi:signal transduction histidine kinase